MFIIRNSKNIFLLNQIYNKLDKQENFVISIGKNTKDILIEANNIIIAGATNCGKSNFLHTVIVSLLKQRDKNRLKLILIDPKRLAKL